VEIRPTIVQQYILPLAAEIHCSQRKNLQEFTDAVKDNDLRSLLVGQQRLG